ncbi:MAG: preprotein translocase SecE subunit [Planctomycetota bacterium]|jgi:preprotein translocase SecE subunit
MAQYKNQGRMARMTVFWSMAGLLFFGATWLHQELRITAGFFRDPLIASMEKVPMLGVPFSVAFVISTAVLVLGIIFIRRWMAKPSTHETLVETEAEMRKVTWPTLEESINGSFVVIVAVLFLMAFLAGTDYLLTRITRRVLLGLLAG